MQEAHEPPSPPLGAWVSVLRRLDLTEASHRIAVDRIASKTASLEQRVRRLECCYRAAKLMVTLGALLTPAVSGLDASTADPKAVFWLIWSLGLGTAGSNALISLFALDRKYFSLKERVSRLQSEAWLYASLSGKYKRGGTHEELFSSFVENCEHLLHAFSDHSNRHPAVSSSGGGVEAASGAAGESPAATS